MRFMILLFAIACTATSCYRMPERGEYSLLPVTNNPDVTGCHGGSLMPGANI